MNPYYLPFLLLTEHVVGFKKRQVEAEKPAGKLVWCGSFIRITGITYLWGLILNT